MKITLEDGTEQDVFTQEELDAKIAELSKDNEDKMKSMEEELSKLKDKDFNFSTIREAKNKAEQEAEALAAKKAKEIEEIKKSLEDKLSLELKRRDISSEINKLSSDEEERKKITYYFDKLSAGEDESKYREIMEASYKLATGNTSIHKGFISTANAGSGISEKKDEHEEVKWINDMFRIVPEIKKTN